MAVKANQAKSQFLSSMSHELRTPLNAILGFTQVLQMSDNPNLTDKQLKAFEIIHKSGELLLQLINRILELSRIEAGDLELELCSTELPPLIEECIEMMAGAAQLKSVSITNQVEKVDLPLVRTDASRTRQILLNLLSNAIKYNHDGGSVVVRAEQRDGVGLRINIIDSGYGFSDHEHARVFEPFDRLHMADSETPGVGIGLAISKQLIEAIGGAIGFSSQPGAGSDFWIDLPLSDATEQPPIAVPQSNATPVHRHRNRRRRRVLYIEDNMTNFELMENIFEDVENAELLHSPDAESGIELATANPPDLILMDISLPGIDGIEATRILKSQPRTRAIPVIGISAAAMADDIERARDVGFYAYKTKPFSIDEFLRTIHLVMDQFSA
jgi:CheY-like chemotaxis protein